jgi:hypothetical protein
VLHAGDYLKLPNASCPLGKWGQTAPTADDPAPTPVTTKPQVPEPQKTEPQKTEPQKTEATPAPLKNVAFVLDDEVVRTLQVDERFAAILLSNPVIVEVPQQAEEEAALKPGDYYFSDGTTWSPSASTTSPAAPTPEGAVRL